MTLCHNRSLIQRMVLRCRHGSINLFDIKFNVVNVAFVVGNRMAWQF